MNFYIKLINDTVDYIENNIDKNIDTSDISAEFNMSQYHFERIFMAVVGKSLKKYILERKLTEAYYELSSSNASIIDAAMDFGFNYPEVFSRAFKKHFGVSPNDCRKKPIANTTPKAEIIPRNLISYSGGLMLKVSYVYLGSLTLEGIFMNVDVNDSGFKSVIRRTSNSFLSQVKAASIMFDKFYSTINCLSDGSGKYTIFSGIHNDNNKYLEISTLASIKSGWYAEFTYNGEMLEICSTFIDDLFKWIAVNEIELDSNNVGLVSIYDKDYFNTHKVQILVPVIK